MLCSIGLTVQNTSNLPQKQLSHHPTHALASTVLVVACMRMLFNSKAGNGNRAGQHFEPRRLRQGFADVPRQGGLATERINKGCCNLSAAHFQNLKVDGFLVGLGILLGQMQQNFRGMGFNHAG
jgi:hypothetical protein